GAPRHTHAEAPGYPVGRYHILPRDGDDVDRRKRSRLAPGFHIELRADGPNEFRAVSFRRKHAAEKKQIARLHRFSVCTERLRRCRQLDAEFFQALLGARRVRALAWY